MRSIRVWLMCAAVVVVAIASYGAIPHVLYGKRIAGQVVDADTGAPIAGVHVAFLWESDITPRGFTAHNSRTICYHAAATITDAHGQFQIEPWREWSTYGVEPVDPIALVYVRDYAPRQIAVRGDSADRPTDHLAERYALKRFTGSAGERIDAMFWAVVSRDCRYGGNSQKSLYPMLKSVHAEAKETARSEQQRSTASAIALIAAKAAIALDPTGPGADSQVEEFIDGNLK
jgi:hypothetical protein